MRKKRKKTNYRITIGYKAVISVEVQANSEDEAKLIALEEFKKRRDNKMYGKNIILEDDLFGVDGVVNQDKTWGML